MAQGEFRPYFKPTAKPREYINKWYLPFFSLSDTLKLRTRVLLGALLQILLCATLPMKWAVVPACAMLVHSIALTVVQVLSPDKNPYTDGAVPTRVTAQLPSQPSGAFGNKPASQSLVVFNLGVQFNHPLGPFAPGAMQVVGYFEAMERDLHSRRDELGLLDMSLWRGSERESNSTLLITFTFRDMEGLHRFAHEPLHREAWDWWGSKARSPKHIGILHETYCVPAGAYETIYVNCRPVLLGRGQVRTGLEGRDEVWRNTLVSADDPALKTQYARMNRDGNGAAKA